MSYRQDIDNNKTQIISWLEDGISRAEVSRRLDCKIDTLISRLKEWNSLHLKNQGYGSKTNGPKRRKSPKSYLIQNSSLKSDQLKKRLWRDGLKPRECEECGWSTYSKDGRLPLELHHIDGNKHNNRLENLIVLCPNCHALKPNNSGRNTKAYRARVAKLVNAQVLETCIEIYL